MLECSVLCYQIPLPKCLLKSMAWETQPGLEVVAVLEAASVLRVRSYFLGPAVLWCLRRSLTGKYITEVLLASEHKLLLHAEALIFE